MRERKSEIHRDSDSEKKVNALYKSWISCFVKNVQLVFIIILFCLFLLS